MSNAIPRVPSYRLHKPSGQAVVTIGGRDLYLGKHKSAASRAEYGRVIAEWSANGGAVTKRSGNDLTVVELVAAFMRHAQGYYRRPDGTPTTEVKNLKLAIRRLKHLYGRTRVADFGPLALKTVRQQMIAGGLARGTINKDVNRIRRIFKWGVENELLEPSVLHGLQAVSGLRRGRSNAKETPGVKPVPEAFVEAVLPYVSSQVAAMIQLQRLTGMRSGEVATMRGCDISTSGHVWVYTPDQHKTAWHGHDRRVYLGPKAQAIAKPFLKADLQAFLFSPAEAEAVRHERRYGVVSRDRKTKVYPCELKRRARERVERQRRGRLGKLRNRYDSVAYYRAIVYGIEAANRARLAEAKAAGMDVDKVDLVPHWHPHQLRHSAATELRREYDLEVARIILGHRSTAATEVYAEVDHARAIDVMARIG